MNKGTISTNRDETDPHPSRSSPLEVTARFSPITRVSSIQGYNAFSDIATWKGYIWIAFRNGTKHVANDGRIIVCRSVDGSTWEQVAIIERDGLDMRDPRLAVLDDKLHVLAFSLDYHDTDYHTFRTGSSYIYAVGEDGGHELVCTYSEEEYGDILWSLVKIGSTYYVSGYKPVMGHYSLRLMAATDISGPWKEVSKIPDDRLAPNVGFNEADMVVGDGGTITLFCRVDRDSRNRIKKGDEKIANKAMKKRSRDRGIKPCRKNCGKLIVVAKSNPPYAEWDLEFHKIFLKGPRAIAFGDNFLFIGRHYNSRDRLKNIDLFLYDGKFKKLETLARGKDGSYAGLCWNPRDPRELLVSFYSDHERLGTPDEGKANDVWFTRVLVEGD
ncbi:MAG: hypothetical protein ACTSUE_00535 [Promethearchaeota archaeon]